MSVGFGFSVGDFLSAIALVGNVIDALRESGEAGAQYRELLRQLLSLETALILVKRVGPELRESQHAEYIALCRAVSQCHRTIDDFWSKSQKYQGPLSSGSSGSNSTSRAKDVWAKIRWALCKKEDVARFKMDLFGHTEAIQLLITTAQM
jgi:hypothetical protein